MVLTSKDTLKIKCLAVRSTIIDTLKLSTQDPPTPNNPSEQVRDDLPYVLNRDAVQPSL